MMEFWPEHQGHSSLYARFGTVPRRNCAHNYHDRHQTTSYPFSYGEQQDQGRECGYWTVPDLRTGRALQDSANWTHSELAAPSSSHFPFILDRQTQLHQDTGVYRPYEVRGREWTAAQQAAGDHDRGFQRERWQRRWEHNPVRYERQVPTKRSNSYQGLEAWAAQYSHSLPRRKNREEELRCISHGLLESSGPTEGNRSGTNPQVSLLQQVRQSADINRSGVWDREQTLTCHPLQPPALDTSHTLDIKEKAGSQRRMFSHPPGYTAPPPYNSPHMCTPVMQHSNTNREQGGQRQTYWSQPTIKKQDLQDKNKREKEELPNPDGNQTCAQLEELQHRTPGPDAVKAASPINVQDIQQHPQMIQSVQNSKATEQTSSKVIEGKTFRLNKKTGGMTIFCLVSRITDTTETPSWPLSTSQANIQSSEFTEVSEGRRDSSDILQRHESADEVDFSVATPTERSTSDTSNITTNAKTIPIFTDNHETETGVVSPENNHLIGSTFGRQVAQCAHPVPVKYPLWREPSFTSRAVSENPSVFLKADHEEEQSGGLHSQEKSATAHPINVEVRRLDIKRDTQSEDSESLLVIDTTCVVVKMELIPPAKKDHVLYLNSTVHTGENLLHIQSSTVLKSNIMLETEQDSNMEMKKASEGGGDASYTCKPSSSFSERETLVECSERIPGIPLRDSITEEESEEAPSFLDLCVEIAEPLSVTNNNHHGTGQLPYTKEDHLVICQTEDQVQNEDGEHFAGPQEQVSSLYEETDPSQLEANLKTSQETKKTENSQFEPTGEEGTAEENEEEIQLVENDSSLQYPCEGLSKSSLLSHSNLTSLSYISQSTTEENLNVVALNPAEILDLCPETSSLPDTSSHQQPSPLYPGSTKSSPSSTPLKCHSPSPSPDLKDQLTEPISGIEDDKNESSELVNDDFTDTSKNLEEQEVVSQQQLEFEKSGNDTCGEERNITDEQQTEADSDPDHLLTCQTEDKAEDQVQNEDGEHFAGPQEQVSSLCEETDHSQLEANVKTSQETKKTENSQLGPTGEEGAAEENEEENQPVENDSSLQYPYPCEGLSKSSLLSHSNLTSLSYISQSTTEENLDVVALNPAENLAPRPETSSLPDTTSHQQPSPLYPGSTKSSPSSTPHKCHSTSPSPELKDQLMEPISGIEDDKNESSELVNDDFTDVSKNLEEQQLEVEKSDNDTFGEDKSDNDTSGEDKSDNDTFGEDKSDNDTFGEDKSDNETSGEDKSDSGEDKSDNDTSGEERNINDEQQTEADSGPEDLWEQTFEPSKDNAPDVDILQKQAKDITCNKVSHLTKEQLQQKASKDPTGLTTLQENTTDRRDQIDHDKINILLFDDDQEEGVSCATESFVTEKKSQREASEDTGHEVQMSETLKDTIADCQTRVDVQIVQEQFYFSQEENMSCVSLTAEEPSEMECDEEQSISQENVADSGSDYESSGPDCKVSPSQDLFSLSELPSPSHIESNIEHISDCLERDTACFSALNPISADVGIRETISRSPFFDSCEESSPFSSSPANELLPDWTPPHGGEDFFFDLPNQYPKSLWDAVNRIRKHTAPDSENEEEEVSEHWDPESIREGMGFPDAVFNMNSESVVKQDPCSTEQSVEEDTLSCSSHSSGDTVILTEEDEFEEIQHGQVFAAADGEGPHSGEVNDETAAEEEREDQPVKGSMKEFCLSEETSDENEKINSVREDTRCDC